MSQKIKIILAKSSECIYCQYFEPIFKTAENIYKLNDFFKNQELIFDNYNMIDKTVMTTFKNNYSELINQIKGYPTVFIYIEDTSNNKIIDFMMINHVIIDPKIDKKKQVEEAANRFLENIINGIKTLKSDNKIEYIQTGGVSINVNYKSKYLKYKSKYHELKNKLNKK